MTNEPNPAPLTPEEQSRLPKSLDPVLSGFVTFVNDRCCSIEEERECHAESLALERDILALVDGLAALREENERLRRERADGGTKAMPPRPPPLPGPRPARAVAGTSLVCTECGCRWKKHPPDDVFSNGSLQLYDADQRPCAECCDNTFHPPLRHETPDDAKGDHA